MGRLHAAGMPVYLLLGNHDADNEMTRRLELPPNVHRFPSNKAATFRIPELQVALHGLRRQPVAARWHAGGQRGAGGADPHPPAR